MLNSLTPSPPAAEKMMPPSRPPAIPIRIVPMQPAPWTPVTPVANAPATKPTTIHDSHLMSTSPMRAPPSTYPPTASLRRPAGTRNGEQRFGRLERSPIGCLDRFPARSRCRGRDIERSPHPEPEAAAVGGRDGRPLPAGLGALVRRVRGRVSVDVQDARRGQDGHDARVVQAP